MEIQAIRTGKHYSHTFFTWSFDRPLTPHLEQGQSRWKASDILLSFPKNLCDRCSASNQSVFRRFYNSRQQLSRYFVIIQRLFAVFWRVDDWTVKISLLIPSWISIVTDPKTRAIIYHSRLGVTSVSPRSSSALIWLIRFCSRLWGLISQQRVLHPLALQKQAGTNVGSSTSRSLLESRWPSPKRPVLSPILYHVHHLGCAPHILCSLLKMPISTRRIIQELSASF